MVNFWHALERPTAAGSRTLAVQGLTQLQPPPSPPPPGASSSSSSGLCFHLSSYLYEFVKLKFRGFYYMASVCVCVGRYCLLPEIIFINKICIWHLRREEAETKTRLVACVASTAEHRVRGEGVGMGRSSGHGLAFDTHTIVSGLNRGRARITAGLSPRLSFGIQVHVVLCVSGVVCVCVLTARHYGTMECPFYLRAGLIYINLLARL